MVIIWKCGSIKIWKCRLTGDHRGGCGLGRGGRRENLVIIWKCGSIKIWKCSLTGDHSGGPGLRRGGRSDRSFHVKRQRESWVSDSYFQIFQQCLYFFVGLNGFWVETSSSNEIIVSKLTCVEAVWKWRPDFCWPFDQDLTFLNGGWHTFCITAAAFCQIRWPWRRENIDTICKCGVWGFWKCSLTGDHSAPVFRTVVFAI